jgi:hypothetical protein
MVEQFRVIVLKDGDRFVAQCLEIDISSQGLSEADVLAKLKLLFRAEADVAREKGCNLADIGPAPERFHAIYGAEVVGRSEFKMVA